MPRHSRGTVADELHIPGDELEHHRLKLENNLQHTDISLRLSSPSDDDNYHHNSSVEYPRHNSGPTPFSDFPSFDDHRSRDQFTDDDLHGHVNAWSYRTGDDEDGINPYGGETVSTAAHHASALTISAGLGGGRAARRDVSLSGAEYDPDRPLHDIVAGVGRMSMLDMDPSRSKYQSGENITYDPLVVDSTAELDRILQSGYAPPPSSRTIHPHSPISSESASESESGQSHISSRPKLSDALRRVSFSPKRPRSPQPHRLSPLAQSHHLPNTSASMNMPTPKPSRRASNGIKVSPPQPEVRLHPPTPSTAGSKFTRMARGINRELEAEQSRWQNKDQEEERPASAPPASTGRNSFHDASRTFSTRHHTSRSSIRATPRNKVHLPDVTGLTNAVESPAKHGADYFPYRADDRPSDNEARLLQTLSTVQNKLLHLEDENSISRRRVRELEHELEECKHQVARERTRLINQEEMHHHDLHSHGGQRNKGKEKAKEVSVQEDDQHHRYREAVEEKKALEALIKSLRIHLTRLTSELSSHKELLNELRNLRNSDARTLREKSDEITQLKEEVERLAGEVEVLRGVVEEGLNERRASREPSVVPQSDADVAMSQDIDSEGEEEESKEHYDREQHDADEEEEYVDDANDDEESEPLDPRSIHGSSQVDAQFNRTMRTDHATLGSSNRQDSTTARIIDSEELENISAEIMARRLNNSGSAASQHSQGRVRSPSPLTTRPRRPVNIDEDTDEDRLHLGNGAAPLPHPSSRRTHLTSRPDPQNPDPLSSQLPGPAARSSRNDHPIINSPETPFPQIRGERLERLFFSAPEHDAKTCTVCSRRRRAHPTTYAPSIPSSYRRRASPARNLDEDEGFAEGSEEAEPERGAARHFTEPEQLQRTTQTNGLPPQTVLSRVIRELEDDFTHYKSIYVELADQYKDMDAVSDVPKRNTLARHLREVVDILEQKGNQIASLYDLLTFKEK